MVQFILSVALFLLTSVYAATEVHYEVYRGDAAAVHLRDLIPLRTKLFWEYPNLYVAHDEEHESVDEFKVESAILVFAYADDQLVGAVAGVSLHEMKCEEEFFDAQYELNGKMPDSLEEYFYVVEIFVDHQYQRRGIARTLMTMIEHEAEVDGYKWMSLMTVERPENHPFRPAEYSDIEQFWGGRGYEQTEVVLQWQWLTRVGEPGNERVEFVPNPMRVWVKPLQLAH